MIDYNEFLSDDEKIKHLQAKIDIEKSKLSQILSQDKDINKRLLILEEYFVALNGITQKYDILSEGIFDANGGGITE